MDELIPFFDVPKSSYFNWARNHKVDKDAGLKGLVVEIFDSHKMRYGYRRITAELHGRGLTVNHKKVKRIMRELGLCSRTRKAARYSSYKGTIGKTAPNRLARRFDVKEPDKVWGTDVTEFFTGEGKVYLSPMKDFCTGEIIGYTCSASPTVGMVMEMLREAIAAHPLAEGLMLHSDQGFQYQHALFVNCLEANDLAQSMSRKGNCLDNSKMETFFATMKREMYHGHEKEFRTGAQLYEAIDQYIEYYNEDRIQIKLNCLPPLFFRRQAV